MASKFAIYYINLDRVPERAAYLEAQLSDLGLVDCTQKISAVDVFETNIRSNYDQSKLTTRWELLPLEISIFESHRKVWKRIVEDKQPHTIILEDDIILSKVFGKTVDNLLNSISQYDVFKLDGHSNKQLHFGTKIHLNDVSVRPILRRIGSAGCYLLSLSGANKLLERSSTYCDTVDDFIFEPRADWIPLQAEPAIGVQGVYLEDKYTKSIPKIISQSEWLNHPALRQKRGKGPIGYRIKKEIHRLGVKIFIKYFGQRIIIKHSGKIGTVMLEADLGHYKD